MPVDVEVDDVAVLLGPHPVGQAAQPGQVVGVVEILAVLAGEALARLDLLGEFGLAGLGQRHVPRVRGSHLPTCRARADVTAS